MSQVAGLKIRKLGCWFEIRKLGMKTGQAGIYNPTINGVDLEC